MAIATPEMRRPMDVQTAQPRQEQSATAQASALDKLNLLNQSSVLDTLAAEVGMDEERQLPALGEATDSWREIDQFEAGFPPPRKGHVQYGARVEWRDGSPDTDNYRRLYNLGYRARPVSPDDTKDNPGKRYSTASMSGRSVYYVAGHLLMDIPVEAHARLMAIQNKRIEFQSAGVRLAEETKQFDPRQVRFSGNASASVGVGRDATALID